MGNNTSYTMPLFIGKNEDAEAVYEKVHRYCSQVRANTILRRKDISNER